MPSRNRKTGYYWILWILLGITGLWIFLDGMVDIMGLWILLDIVVKYDSFFIVDDSIFVLARRQESRTCMYKINNKGQKGLGQYRRMWMLKK